MVRKKVEQIINNTTYKGKLLASNVLAVAVINDDPSPYISEWSAYIGATSTNIFDEEFMNVARHGSKLPKAIAKILFPDVPKEKRWRS